MAVVPLQNPAPHPLKPAFRQDYESVDARRSKKADSIFESFDFGYMVSGASGWERTIPGNTFSRTIYLEGDNAETPSIPATLTVRFDDDDSVLEAYAYLLHSGDRIGNRNDKIDQPEK